MNNEIDKNQQQEEMSSSTLFVFKGSQKDFYRMMSLFEAGELSDLLGIEVLDVGAIVESQLVAQPKVINLSQWFQNNFVEAIQEAWLTLEEVFGKSIRNPAFRSQAVKRAKSIQLGDRTVALILDIAPAENPEISTILGVYPIGSQTYLPENLKLNVYESEETLVELQAPLQSEGMIQELFFLPGEAFRIEVSLGDFKQIENFLLFPTR
ncbi:MAG TPA: hypothetical protein DD001_05280 [Microcoleaceae bacterium UBA10368]|jgi:Protein of unknown function (DUF1822).|nr:hypothetical protein [Microcoleaceae cyanobacterium UBA10368]HCV32459.1 hypothetical protein [Microcoleaceae cyanobacterium UBA9251]